MKKNFSILALLLFTWILQAQPAAAAPDYVIGDGDGLQVAVWGAPELSGSVTVRPDGKITLPAVGDLEASGLTPEKLSDKLTAELKPFVKKPIVTVTVNGITNNKVYVFGGGASPGAYNLPSRTTLLKFLLTLGDLKQADLERAYLLREGKKLDVDFYDLYVEGDLSKDLALHSEDMLYIPDNELMKIYVMGAIANPQYIHYREGIRILDAILESGGFTKFAKENNVLVLRKNGDDMKKIKVNAKDLMNDGDVSQNVKLQRGDLVIVSEGLF